MMQKHINDFIDEYTETLKLFLNSISNENSTDYQRYLPLKIILSEFESQLLQRIRYGIESSWGKLNHLNSNNDFRSPFYNLNHEEYEQYLWQHQSVSEKLDSAWADALSSEFDSFKNQYPIVSFPLLTDDVQKYKVKGKLQKQMVEQFLDKKIYNLDAWEKYIEIIVSHFLPEFSSRLVKKSKHYYFEFYKEINTNLKVIFEIDLTHFFNIDWVIKGMGRVSYSVGFFVEHIPLETSKAEGVLLLPNPYINNKKLPKINTEDAKLKVYYQLSTYCIFIRQMLPSLENFLQKGDVF